MDQGVIKATKAYYCASVVRRYIDAVEKGKGAPNISVLDAMTILTRAWNKVRPETIKNCFKKAGICSEAQTIAINDLDNPFAVLSSLLLYGVSIPFLVVNLCGLFTTFEKEIMKI